MTVMDAVIEALNTRWMEAHQVRAMVRAKTGHYCSESSITARIRDLRKPQYGGYNVTCRYVDSATGKRVWQYGICD